MKEREMFNNFKSDMGMTDVEWRLFCQRYAIRGKSTVCRSNSFNNAPVVV